MRAREWDGGGYSRESPEQTQASITPIKGCMDQKGTRELRKNRICAQDTLSFSPSCHGTLYLLLFCFPYYVNSLVFQDSIKFFFEALMIWNLSSPSAYRLFLMSASQHSVHSVDEQMSLKQVPRPLWRTDRALESHLLCELLGERERDFISCADTKRSVQFSSVAQSCLTLWDPIGPQARKASQSIINSQNLRKLMSIESVMPSNHLILCHPLLLPPSIFPSITVFSHESVLHIR